MNAPTPFEIAPPADYERRNVIYLRPRLIAQATQDRGMLAATDDIAERQRENLARFYRANPQFGRCSAGEGGHDSRARLPFAERMVMFFRLNGETLTFWFAMGAIGVLLATVVGGYLGGVR